MAKRQGQSPKGRKYDPRVLRRQSDTRRDEQAFVLNHRNDSALYTGATGATGATGPTGPQGPQGPAGVSPSVNDFRLTLASGFPVYNPQPATPSSTDTVNNLVTMSADPGWVTGTLVTPALPGLNGGLTGGTIYYLRRLSSTTFSFYTSLANAQSDSSRVALTSAIGQINPSGVSNTTLYISPFRGNAMALFDGTSTWNIRTSAEFSVALGTLTSGLPHDIFVYDNATVPTADAPLPWTNGSTRATAIQQQNGAWVKSTDTKRRLMGTIRTNTTTTSIDDAGGLATQTGAKRFVGNVDNRIARRMREKDTTGAWSYSSTTWRQANGAAGNILEWVNPLSLDCIDVSIQTMIENNGNDAVGAIGVSVDSTTAQPEWSVQHETNSGQIYAYAYCRFIFDVAPGYHYAAWMEQANNAGNTTRFGSFNFFAGMEGIVWL